MSKKFVTGNVGRRAGRRAGHRQRAAAGHGAQFIQVVDSERLQKCVVRPIIQISGSIIRVSELLVQARRTTRFLARGRLQLADQVVGVIDVVAVREGVGAD